MEALLSNHWSEPHGFIGGLPGQAEEIAARFKLSSQVSYCSPMRPFSVENAREDWDMFLARCPGRKPPRFIWVGLGAPKQEFWVEAISHLAPDSIFFAIGAAFDFHSGRKKRAPAWMQKSGLEWLYRLSTEPRRLGSRYLRTNSAFILKLGSTWFGSGSTGRGRH
jgi:N-acetylglucosaminyldiphosphoundecaprenol N-acetyl-beta-D-mannosaminyltransferase